MPRKQTKPTANEAEKDEPAQQANEVEWSDSEDDLEDELPRRRDLLAEALRMVRAALKSETKPSRTTVGNLVQLIKLHKELVAEEEALIRTEIVWEVVHEKLFSEN